MPPQLLEESIGINRLRYERSGLAAPTQVPIHCDALLDGQLTARKHNDGDVPRAWSALNPSEQIVAAPAGHVIIRDDGIRFFLKRQPKTLHAIACGNCCDTVALKSSRKNLHHNLVILDQQHPSRSLCVTVHHERVWIGRGPFDKDLFDYEV